MTRFEEMDADGMFETLGYVKDDCVICDRYKSDEHELIISFGLNTKEINISTYGDLIVTLTTQELQAITKKCVKLGWLKERD